MRRRRSIAATAIKTTVEVGGGGTTVTAMMLGGRRLSPAARIRDSITLITEINIGGGGDFGARLIDKGSQCHPPIVSEFLMNVLPWE
jgi:hypothetical protein